MGFYNETNIWPVVCLIKFYACAKHLSAQPQDLQRQATTAKKQLKKGGGG